MWGRIKCLEKSKPYLTGAIPPYELLSEEGLQKVEHHADQLLEKIGLEIRGDPEAIRLWWLEAGLAMSYEKFVMDVDQLGAFHTLARGISLDENGFALEVFREIGPGKPYLGSTHTMANYLTAFYDFELADNNSYEQ